jgi:hypothetical protein
MKEYRYIGKDGMPILARDLEDQRDAALAKLAKAVEALQTFKDFDDLPLECKRPDVFEIKVRKTILIVLAELKGDNK